MPESDENCAIWATIWLLSTGANGSWFFSCAVISARKSDTPMSVLPSRDVSLVSSVVPLVVLFLLYRETPSPARVESKSLMISGPA